MKLLLDENIPFELAEILREIGHDVKHVYDVRLSGKDDDKIISFARSQKRIFITMDLDFANIINYPPEKNSGIIVAKIGKPSKDKIIQTIKSFIQTIGEKEISKALVIVEENRYRLRK